jgi:hypothetical protein
MVLEDVDWRIDDSWLNDCAATEEEALDDWTKLDEYDCVVEGKKFDD